MNKTKKSFATFSQKNIIAEKTDQTRYLLIQKTISSF